MTQTVLQICTDAARWINLIDETGQLSPEQGVTFLTLINDKMADMAKDGVQLGWYPQNSLANTAPLQDSDMRIVKLVLAKDAMVYYSIENTISPEKKELMDDAEEKLAKRALLYFESDMSGLPTPQGAWWGGGSANT
jgi:hypothetical protein